MGKSLLSIFVLMTSCIPVPDFEREEVEISKTHGNINVKYVRCIGGAPDQNYKTYVSISDGTRNDTILWYRKIKDIAIHSDTILIELDEKEKDGTKILIY